MGPEIKGTVLSFYSRPWKSSLPPDSTSFNNSFHFNVVFVLLIRGWLPGPPFPVLCSTPFLCTSLTLLDHRGVGAIPVPQMIVHPSLPFLVLGKLLALFTSGTFWHILRCSGKASPTLWGLSSLLHPSLSQLVIPFPFFPGASEHTSGTVRVARPGQLWEERGPLLIITLGQRL